MNDETKRVPEEALPMDGKEGESIEALGNDCNDALPKACEEAETMVCEPASDSYETRGEAPCDPQEDRRDDPPVLGMPDDPDRDPDPASAEAEAAKLAQLQRELEGLEERIAERQKTFLRLERECAEFRKLYPETPLSALSDKVWEDVQAGVPMAAAFALAERKRVLLEAEAKRMNEQNEKMAPGELSGSGEIFFSPAEVRAMTPEQVRKNYEKIIHSMEKWN